MKIMHIVGNRPQFVKLATLYPELARRGAAQAIVHTGQHFDQNMSAIFFTQLNIPAPDYSLNINKLSHNELIGQMLISLDGVLLAGQPELVIVYGDTNTTLAAALATRKRGILLAHVEAGIRTGDEGMPEESNRYLTDRMAHFNFCCTSLGMKNLEGEGLGGGVAGSRAFLSGDLMLDAVRLFGPQAESNTLPAELKKDRPYVLATIHREENLRDPGRLGKIIAGLENIHREKPVVFAIHPHTRDVLEKNSLMPRVHLCEAQGYFEMLGLLKYSAAVITDSGGLAREAFFFSRPTLVVMENPFWPELFENGNCLPANPVMQDLTDRFHQLEAARRDFDLSVFGDGHAAEKISEVLTAAINK